MKSFIFLLVVGVAWAGTLSDQMVGDSPVFIPGDADFLQKQSKILKLFNKIHEHNRYNDQVDIATSFNPLDHLGDFKHRDCVLKLVKKYKAHRLLPRGHVFNLFRPRDREEMVMFFEALFYAKTWDTFYKIACWARDKINENQFLYAMYVAVHHRHDCKGVLLPPQYEIYPQLFVNNDVIQEAYSAKMKQVPATIKMHWTGTIRNPEQHVAYFGEDLGLNSHHSHWHMDFPFWWKKAYGTEKDRKGELFFYSHHELTTRYDLQRLSNNLPIVGPLAWDKPIHNGFYPQAAYRNGHEFPARPDDVKFTDLDKDGFHIKVSQMKEYERRIRDAIAMKAVYGKDGHAISLNNTHGINTLAEIIEASAFSVNPDFYGSIHNMAHIMLGELDDPQGKYGTPPGVMEHFETATRDPSFFRLHKYIDSFFKEHKDSLPPYTTDELDFHGVEIVDVEVDKLMTFFDDFEIDLTMALDDTPELADVPIKAISHRLNHAPFTYLLKMKSDASHVATVRIFLGPKYNSYGEELSLDTKRWMMVEMDKFVVHLHSGNSEILRKSTESSVTIPDPKGYKGMVEAVKSAIAGDSEFKVNKEHRHCGIPDRLLLPKGSKEGTPFTLFVMVTDFDDDNANTDVESTHDYGGSISYCGTLTEGQKYPDKKPMGFPFDRHIEDVHDFKTKNMIVKDVVVTHKSDH
uniref:Hemocyanin subunit 1 n=1 Tax=Xibalbanus tulumensis TaxID=1519145 RepID=D0R092_XIBTU|nr:hemocyanin subunit 1 precursor [Xibalbanus tulumensis]